jgi:hypothetical protein
MTEISKRAFVGLLGLGLLSFGCSSSNSSGTGGSNGSGGSGTGTGGVHTTGNGGATTTGNGGAGGAGIGCPSSDMPTSPTIAGFVEADGGTKITISGGVMGGISTFGNTPPTYQLASGGGLEIMQNEGQGASPDYTGVVIYFNGNAMGTDCVNASSYQGIQFDMSGTFSGCAVVISNNDKEHETNDPTAMETKGVCAKADNCYSPQLPLTHFASPSTIMVPFSDAGFNPGSPATNTDPANLTGFQLQIATPAATDAGAGTCTADLVINNVKFY